MINIIFYRKKCIGCSSCVLISPFFFVMSRIDGKSLLIKSEKKKKDIYILKRISNKNYKNLIKTSKICPVKIIKIIKY